MGAGRVLCACDVDACALVYFQFHPRSVGRSVGRSVDPALHLGTLVPRQKKYV